MRIVLTISALLALSACGGGRMGMEILTDYNDGHEPEFNRETEVVVGEAIHARFQYYENRGAVTTDPFIAKNGLISMQLPAGTDLVGLRDEQGYAYCTKDKAIIDAFVGPWRYACFEDLNNDKAFETIWASDTGITLFAPAFRSVVVRYESKSLIEAHVGAFRFEIIFEGMTNNVLRLNYREFKDDLAKPTFTQQRSYTLNDTGDTEVRFRDARIIVHDATNSTLRYTVIDGLSS